MSKQFSIDFKTNKNKVVFKVDKATNVIPSKMFPIVSPVNMDISGHNNTENFSQSKINNEIKEIFNNKYIKRTNSIFRELKMIEMLLQIKNINHTVFAGWVFKEQDFPFYNVWIMIEEKHILDISMTSSYLRTRIDEELKEDENVSINSKVQELLQDKTIRNSDKYIFGKAINGVVYIGSPCSIKIAEKKYIDLKKKFEKHPSLTF